MFFCGGYRTYLVVGNANIIMIVKNSYRVFLGEGKSGSLHNFCLKSKAEHRSMGAMEVESRWMLNVSFMYFCDRVL